VAYAVGDSQSILSGWRVHLLRETLPSLPVAPAVLAALGSGLQGWAGSAGIPVGTPFLISPGLEYDVELNRFFYSADMLCCRIMTRLGYARDLAAFLSFLHRSRGGRGWRDATEDDHTAYLVWRLFDSSGPRVSGGTWDREVSGVNRFYQWQAARGNVAGNPVPQRVRRQGPAGVSGRAQGAGGETPATHTHGARAERIQWFPAASYRQWRDIGVRGYRCDGLADPAFRGRWAARNAVFCDLMVRTGLRLAEQASLTVFEVPLDRSIAGYLKFWLAPAIAKGGSSRWVYVPASVVADLAAYAEIDRRDVIADAQASGRYRKTGHAVLVADGERPVAREHGAGRGEMVKISQLSAAERRRLFVEGPGGLEPAAFWLSEDGQPVSVSTWKNMFAQANTRCARHGADLHAHAHLLRHTFAVLTLEQMQRGHIAALAELNPEQRGHYTRIFGDPLDWVRRRLGHASITTTQIYLHALEELEMETRMALVPDSWEDPRDTPHGQFADDARPGTA
jgi:site-specific recombinase XerD